MTVPTSRLATWCCIAFAALASTDLVWEWHDVADVSSRIQPLLMIPLAGYLLATAPQPLSRLTTCTLAGLFFSWCGDTLPNFAHGDGKLDVLIGSFLVAQIFFITGFRDFRADSVLAVGRRRWLVLYAAYAVALIGLVVPHAGVLAPAVVIYGLCLVSMAVTASGVDPVAWVGGAIFCLSDGLIALDAFDVWTQPHHDVWVMATYCVAELCLVVGVVRRLHRVRSDHPSPSLAG